MKDLQLTETVLLIGNGKLAASVYVCLIQAGFTVDFYSDSSMEVTERINQHLSGSHINGMVDVKCRHLDDFENYNNKSSYHLGVIITGENLTEKNACIMRMEKRINSSSIIAVNTESIPLSTLQLNAAFPSRIIGVNWSEPAHTTFFLEIITNHSTPKHLVDDFYHLSKSWQKDPYILYNDNGIRAHMMCAMIREAFYLVENGYVSIEDIDRACRNDAGFYLPFAGNFRYMDLMGTYMYGIVMKDLNPELCSSAHIPTFFKDIIDQGGEGMANNKGIYSYQNGDTEKWDDIFRTFSYQIQEIIQKYSSENNEQEKDAKVLISSMHE